MIKFDIRPLATTDRDWLKATLIEHWTSYLIASRGHLIDASQLPGFVAVAGEQCLGLLTYHIVGHECEIVTLNSFREGSGVGTALMSSAIAAARSAGCRRLWLITTNDNVDAIRFYARLGLRLIKIHHDAIAESRRLKPTIPATGCYGLPIRDEIEFELMLG